MACEVCKKPYVPEDYDFDSDRKPHECSICGKGFSLKIQLKRHMLLHEGNVPYVCDSCEKNLDETSSYNLRLSQKGDFSCETCGKVFPTKRSLLRHAGEHTLENVLNCDECGESFKNMTALKRHSATHKPKKRTVAARNAKEETDLNFTCEECGKNYSDFTQFELHCAGHLKKFKCDKCNVCFNSNKILGDHKKSCCSAEGNNSSDTSAVSSHIKKFKCDKCNVYFNSGKILGEHKKSCATAEGSHSDTMKEDTSNSCKHVCNICAKSFTRKSTLEGHMFSHYEEENHESPVEDDSDKDVDFRCDQKNDKPSKSDKLDDLTRELCLPKLKIRRSSVMCEICGMLCTTRKVLRRHMVSHKTPRSEVKVQNVTKKTYQCRICSEVFDVKEAYKKHKVTHRGTDDASKGKDRVKTHTCAICQKVFSKRKHLKKHIRNHLDSNNEENSEGIKRQKRIKNFACTYCGKRFAGEICMKKHEAKHGNNNSNDDSNSNNPDMPVKMRKYSKKPKPLICEFCNEDFTGRRHIFVKHKLSHTPEVCGICDARFKDRASLREHCKIHIGTEEGRRFLECSQKALAAKNGVAQPEPKVEYIYLVLR